MSDYNFNIGSFTLSALGIISMLFLACSGNYDCGDLVHKEGFYYEKATGNLASGFFECTEIRNGGGGNTNHVTKYKYKNGLEIGKWTYHAQGQLIHRGEFIEASTVEELITSKTNAKAVQLEAWYEGDYGELNIYIISSKQALDSLTAQSIIKNNATDICKKYKLESISIIEKVNGQEWARKSFPTQPVTNH